MKRFLVLLLFLPLCLIVSCEKEDNPINPDKEEIEPLLPSLFIDTEDHMEITTKDNYVPATIKIEGKNQFEDYQGTLGIRGRGNTTWGMPKKPYKLKLDSKASLMGMAPYKTWILLAEYLDGSMLYNSIPFKAAEMLDMPYTNHIIPVELTLNGKYQGFYVFTEHKEVGENRIDIGEDGWLLELDAHFDEPLQFKSQKYDLPVMIKFPKYKNMSESESQDKLQEIKNDFEGFEAMVYDENFPDNDYLEYFDALSFVNYMIVYQLTSNQEINHPKSTYIHKKANDKYRMGIIWDFDWGFGFSPDKGHYMIETANAPLFWPDESPGTRFFSKFMEDPYIQELFSERWDWFKTHKYQELKSHVRQYSTLVRQAYKKDHEIWGNRNSTGDPEQDLERVLSWLDARVDYIDSYVAGF